MHSASDASGCKLGWESGAPRSRKRGSIMWGRNGDERAESDDASRLQARGNPITAPLEKTERKPAA